MRGRAPVLMLMAVLVGIGVLVGESPAAARHNFSMLEVHPRQAAAGDVVSVWGYSYTKPAFVRFGAVDGPVLARLEPTPNNDIQGTVRIPPDARPGRYILFAMHQDENGRPTRFPGQAAIVVSGPGGPPVNLTTGLELEPRPRGVLERGPVPLSNLVLVGLAAAVAASLLAAVVLLVLSKRRGVANGTSP